MIGRPIPCALLLALASLPAAGLPVVDEMRTVEAFRCFPDHEDPAVWWFLPQRLQLASHDAGPGFSFLRYRYKGSAASGDTEEFWSRGVLTFEVSFTNDARRRTLAKSALERLTGRAVTLRRLPIQRIESVLVYAGALADDDSSSSAGGSIEGGEWEHGEGAWDQRVFTVGLDSGTSDLLWDSFQRGSLALSLSYSLIGQALASRPPADGGADDSKEVRAEQHALVADSLAVRVSPEQCAGCFRLIDLDAKIPADYPFLEVACHDFEAGELASDLELVQVRVRALAVNGDRPIEQVEFAAGDGSTKMPVKFPFAVDLEAGYDYQVIREYSDGSEPEPWVTVSSWTGRLDVTRYPTGGPKASGLDPRRLY